MPLEGACHHVINESVLVGQASRLVLVLVFVFEHLGERILELAVVRLENRVLGGQVHRIAAHQTIVEAGACETSDGIVHVVLHLGNSAVRAIIVNDVLNRLGAVFRSEGYGEGAGSRNLEISGFVLVSEGVTCHDDRLGPSRDQARHIAHDDRLAEDGAAENVADGTIGGFPHLLEAELLDARLVRGDGGAFDADMFALDGLRRVDGHLIVGGVAVFDAQIVIIQIHVEVRQDQTVLDVFPDDTGHLVAVEFDDFAFDLDFGHGLSSLSELKVMGSVLLHVC